jgi:hypothetical protein
MGRRIPGTRGAAPALGRKVFKTAEALARRLAGKETPVQAPRKAPSAAPLAAKPKAPAAKPPAAKPVAARPAAKKPAAPSPLAVRPASTPQRATAFATHEQAPFVDAGHLSGLSSDEGARALHSADIRGSWTDPQGKDLFYKALGFEQAPTVDATGVYDPPGGLRENNLAKVAPLSVGLQGGLLDPDSRQSMELVEALRAYFDVQGAGAGHLPSAYAPADTAASVFVPQDRQVSKEMLTTLSDLGGKYGLESPIDTGRGVTLTSFDFGNPPQAASVSDALAGDLGSGLRDLLGAEPSQRTFDGVYQPMFERKVSEADDAPYHAPGSGGLTDALREMVLRYPPEKLALLDASPELRAAYARRTPRDQDFTARGYGPAREDAYLARQIASDEGLSGLFADRNRGEKLPGLLIPMLTAGGLGATALGAQPPEPGE